MLKSVRVCCNAKCKGEKQSPPPPEAAEDRDLGVGMTGCRLALSTESEDLGF